tara:strand:- start:640 stop:897 length:258 start_codon:yes stop_codon:yes gene_type:complete
MNEYIDPEETIKILNMIEEPSYKINMEVGDIMYRDIVDLAKRRLSEEEQEHLFFKAGFEYLLEKSIKEELRCTNGQLAFDFSDET